MSSISAAGAHSPAPASHAAPPARPPAPPQGSSHDSDTAKPAPVSTGGSSGKKLDIKA